MYFSIWFVLCFFQPPKLHLKKNQLPEKDEYNRAICLFLLTIFPWSLSNCEPGTLSHWTQFFRVSRFSLELFLFLKLRVPIIWFWFFEREYSWKSWISTLTTTSKPSVHLISSNIFPGFFSPKNSIFSNKF